METNSFHDLLCLILKAISLAMGIAVIVLSLLYQLDCRSAMLLLGIGLTSNGVLHLFIEN